MAGKVSLASFAQDVLAMIMVGDGVLGLVCPKRHVRSWKIGPEGYRELLDDLEERPVLTRCLAAAEVALGIWYASQLHARKSGEPALQR